MARVSIVALLTNDTTLMTTLGVTQILPGTAGPSSVALPLIVYEVLPGGVDHAFGPVIEGTLSSFRFHCYAQTVVGSYTATSRADAIAARVQALLNGFSNAADGVRIVLLDGPPFDGPAGDESLAHRMIDFTVLAT